MFVRILVLVSIIIAGCSGNEKPEVYPGIDVNGGLLIVKLGEKPVLSYALETQFPPDTLPAYYQRSGFIHPLKSPLGVVLTDDFPEGHTHQHGLFLALVNTTFQGNMVDFWNQQNGTGTVRHRELLDSYTSEEEAGFVAMLEHLAFPEGDTAVALQEIWEVDVLNRTDVYVIEFKSMLKALDTIVVNRYHYGGLGFRGPAEWNDTTFLQPGEVNYIGRKGKGGFLTSTGKTRMNGNHSHERWVSFHGVVDSDSAGVVIMSHPDNFRYPQSVRLHPVMPYFSFSPMVDGEFTLLPDEVLVSRYRLIIHDGPPDIRSIEAHWDNWTQ